MPTLESANPTPQHVEYQPNLPDRLSRLLGRVGTRGHDEIITHPGVTVNELLGEFETSGLSGASLDPESEEARQLVAALYRAPSLEKPLFLTQGVEADKSEGVVSINATVDRPVKLPTANFVRAPGMQDWRLGRKGPKSLSNSGSSRQVIRGYARKRTPQPPIGAVSAYIQPNGRVLYSALHDGAHRVAAAHLRGDATVAVGGTILVNRLSENILQ